MLAGTLGQESIFYLINLILDILINREKPVETLSGGTIAAILVVILGIVAGIGLTWYAKKKEKCCFVSGSNNNDLSETWPPRTPMLKEVYFYDDKPSN